jgi:glyceraldehyde-3-phosphate dehydrogenase/erythrose-4-phosphate dehydrogenase
MTIKVAINGYGRIGRARITKAAKKMTYRSLRSMIWASQNLTHT